MNSSPKLSDDEFGDQLGRALRALPDAPAALQRAAIDLWVAPPPSLLLRAEQALIQIMAVLSFDSWAGAAVAQGVRSMRSPTRHLLFSAQGRDIDLRIAPAAEAYALTGQILGPDDGGSVELARDGGEATASRVTQLDDLGEFRIDGLFAGTYRLTLNMGGEQIVLPPVQVGEPAGEPAA